MEEIKIRDIVTQIQNEVAKEDLQPHRAAELLNQLSALIGNILDAIKLADMEYNKVLRKWYDIETKANRAKIAAEATPEYEAKQTARNTKELVLAMIASLKYFLREKEKDWQNSRFQ